MTLVGDVQGRSLEPHDRSARVSNGAASRLHPADVAAGLRDAVVEHVGVAGLHAPPDELFGDDPVVGVEPFEIRLVCRYEPLLVDAEDAEYLVGPRHLVGFDVPLPASEA